MSYVDPQDVQNPATGLIGTTALLAQWRTDQEWLRNAKAGCRCRSNVGTGTAGTLTAIPFELEDYDNQACHDTATNTSRITIPAGWGGMWLLSGVVRFTASTSALLALVKNSDTTTANQLTSSTASPAGTTTGTAALGGLFRFVAGDWIELYGQNGGAVDTTFQPVFSATWWAA